MRLFGGASDAADSKREMMQSSRIHDSNVADEW